MIYKEKDGDEAPLFSDISECPSVCTLRQNRRLIRGWDEGISLMPRIMCSEFKKQQESVLLEKKKKNSFCILFKPCLKSPSISTSQEAMNIKNIKLNLFFSLTYQSTG